jgi:hypothetical protein
MSEDMEKRYILSSLVEFSRRKVDPVTRPRADAIPDARLNSTNSSGVVVL